MSDEFLKKVELIISDVDGVWTDGGMYYGTNGTELKKFSVYDGGAVSLLKLGKIPLLVISGEKNQILEDRFNKLNIRDFRLGIKNKLLELTKIIDEYNVRRENILYIGDFINDYLIMKEVGIPVCPLNACNEIKKISKLIINKKGGEGVLWLLAKKILKSKNKYEKILTKYLEIL